MADNVQSKIDAATEKAYAEAAARQVTAPEAPVKAAAPAAVAAPKPAAAKPAAKKVAAKKVAAKKVAVKKPAAKKVAVKKAPAKKPAPRKVVAAAKTSTKPVTTPANPITQLKDKIMATAKTTDFTNTAKEVAADVQARLKNAYARTGELATEVTAFSKGNVEAIVESGKLLFAGAQELVREDVESGKAAIETVTADFKKIAAVKSPTELMQLQGELARRNFDAAVAFGSKRTEALVKLYNDAFAPISSRVSIATEKLSKAA